jgi:pimeloyl-ACP methyl ester carboxylesterase
MVAPWDPRAADGGRAALLRSVRDARDVLAERGADPDRLTLVGFGVGAVAAAGLARYAKRLGIGLGRIIAVAGAWDEPDPFSGVPIEDPPEQVELVPDSYLLGTTLRRT